MRPGSWIGWGAAIAVSVGGLVTLVVGLVTPTTVGWFAYSPMPSTVSAGDGVLV